MGTPSFVIFNCARSVLFGACFILVIRSSLSVGTSSDNTPLTPTLKFYPEPREAEMGSTFIYYKHGDQGSSQYYIDSINELLNKYESTNYGSPNVVQCSYDLPHSDNKFCAFQSYYLGPCSSENGFGFPQGRPCILLTLNKVKLWMPKVFNETDVEELQDSSERAAFSKMPVDLRQHISALPSSQRSQIWLSCAGDTGADIENMGPIKYYPGRGFPAYYFPLTDAESQSPIIAVQFDRPTRGIVISVECRVWAKNIHSDRAEGVGFTKFNLLID